MKLYFVRHGQSENNKAGIHQGTETTLSTTGKEQARFVAKRLKDKDIDIIFSSPFSRAEETAKIISDELNKEIEIREELKEALWPSEMIGLHHSDPRSKKIRQQILQASDDPDYKYSDEESFNELVERASSFIEHLIKHHDDQTILCVSHGFIQKIFVGLVLFEEEFNTKMFYKFTENSWMDNTGITELEYSKKYGWVLLTWNDKAHL